MVTVHVVCVGGVGGAQAMVKMNARLNMPQLNEIMRR
jgi:hypothetical protein